jgi:hypothetical protein
VLSNLDFHYGRCWPLDLDARVISPPAMRTERLRATRIG